MQRFSTQGSQRSLFIRIQSVVIVCSDHLQQSAQEQSVCWWTAAAAVNNVLQSLSSSNNYPGWAATHALTGQTLFLHLNRLGDLTVGEGRLRIGMGSDREGNEQPEGKE